MPLIDMRVKNSRRLDNYISDSNYYKQSHKDKYRASDREYNRGDHYKVRSRDISRYDYSYHRNSRRSSSRDRVNRPKMTELRERLKDKHQRELPKSYRSSNVNLKCTDKEKSITKRSRSKEIAYNEDTNEKITQCNLEAVKWKEELYGTVNKKIKYDLLHNESRRDADRVAPVTTEYPRAFLNGGKADISGINLKKAIDSSSIKCDVVNEDVAGNVSKRSLHIPKEKVIVDDTQIRVKDADAVMLSTAQDDTFTDVGGGKVPYVVIDYEHEDNGISNDLIYSIIKSSATLNGPHTPSRVISSEFQDDTFERGDNNDIRALADLIVNVPHASTKILEVNVPREPSMQDIIRPWNLIKLCVPNESNFTKEYFNLSRCNKNDPRIESLRQAKERCTAES